MAGEGILEGIEIATDEGTVGDPMGGGAGAGAGAGAGGVHQIQAEAGEVRRHLGPHKSYE